ncbi:MAG: hypothetical protein NTX15_11420 [Candidatus Kapabacteria bacterium]|nr:hypothetical protein [Candidatus Kapabacteria bacterium]
MTRALLSCSVFIATLLSLSAQGLDPSFGLSGKRAVGFASGANDTPTWLHVNADGSVISVATSNRGDGTAHTGVARLTSDGLPDDTFNGTGKNSVLFEFGVYANGALTQTDGKIVVVGMHRASNAGSAATPGVLRFNSDGTLDTSFAVRGQFKQKFDAISSGSFTSVHELAGGRLLCVGASSGNINGGRTALGMMMLNRDGSLDDTWGEGGMIREGNESGIVMGSAIAADSSIWIARAVDVPAGKVYRFVKFTKRGVAASQFEGPFPFDEAIVSNGWFRLNDGSFILAGTLSTSSGKRMTAMKFKANGVVDSTFGTNGTAVVSAPQNCECRGLSVMADGGIFLSGSTSLGFGDGALCKLRGNGVPEPLWGTNGFLVFSLNGSVGTNYIQNVAMTSDGKLVVAGYDFSSDGGDVIIARIGDGPVGVQDDSNPPIHANIIYDGPTPSLRLSLDAAMNIGLEIYNIQGALISSLTLAERSAGSHVFPIDGALLGTGQYLLAMRSAYGRTSLPFVITR